MINQILAEITSNDTMISGDWMLKLIGAIFTGAALVLGRYWGKKEEANKLSLPNPMPEMPFRKVERPVSFDQHNSLEQRVGRIEVHLDVIQRDQASQYRQIIEAGAERELRLTETLHAGLREVHGRLDELFKQTSPARRS